MRQPVREIFDAPAGLGVDERRRRFDRHEIGGGFEHLVAQRHLRLQSLHRLDALADVGAQLVDGLELARLFRPLVVSSGSTFCFASLTMTRNLASAARRARRSDRAASAVNSRIAPGFVPRSWSSSSSTTMPEPTRYKKSVAVRPSTASPSIVPDDVDRRVRVVDERELGVGEIGEALAQRVDLPSTSSSETALERQLDAQLVVADELHLRTDLDDGVELDVAVFLARGDLDLRRGDDVDVVLVHRVDVVLAAARPAAPARARCRCRGAPRAAAAAPCPGRKPGIRTSRASLRNAASIACSNSVAGTTTWSLTLLATPRGAVVGGGVFLVALDGFDSALHKEERVYRRHSRLTCGLTVGCRSRIGA